MIHVLIADDHAVIRSGVRTMLSRAGMEVGEAADGAEAVAKVLQSKPDLVILDLTMPVMSGYEAALELRRFAPEIPVLFFTIHNSPLLAQLAIGVGARGFLNKGDAASDLLDAVEELVVRKGTFFPQSDEAQVVTRR